MTEVWYLKMFFLGVLEWAVSPYYHISGLPEYNHRGYPLSHAQADHAARQAHEVRGNSSENLGKRRETMGLGPSRLQWKVMIWWQSTVTLVTEFPRTFAVLSDWTWVFALCVRWSCGAQSMRCEDNRNWRQDPRTKSKPSDKLLHQPRLSREIEWLVRPPAGNDSLSSKIHLKGTPLASLHSLPAPCPRLYNPLQQITTLQSLHDQSLSLFGLVQAQRELRWRAEHRELQLKAEMTEMRCCASAVTACCGMWRHVAMCLPVATYHIVV